MKKELGVKFWLMNGALAFLLIMGILALVGVY